MAHYDAPAELIFQGEELQAAWNGRIRVCDIWGAQETGRKNEMPSLLGTDFLRHTSARFNSREDLLAIELRPEQGRLVLERRNRK